MEVRHSPFNKMNALFNEILHNLMNISQFGKLHFLLALTDFS